MDCIPWDLKHNEASFSPIKITILFKLLTYSISWPKNLLPNLVNDSIQHALCRIAWNLQGRKLSWIGKKWQFCEENFCRRLTPIISGYGMPKFHGELLCEGMAIKPRNKWMFSPTEVFRYTVSLESSCSLICNLLYTYGLESLYYFPFFVVCTKSSITACCMYTITVCNSQRSPTYGWWLVIRPLVLISGSNNFQ